MGLRTASVRRPHVEVMAPALTETTQTKSFKSKDHLQPASPINNSKYPPNGRGTYCKNDNLTQSNNSNKLEDAISNLNTLALVSETLLTASVNSNSTNIMSNSPSMGDQNMGLEKNDDSLTKLQNDKSSFEVEQLLNNLTSEQSEKLMQVIKTIESNSSNEIDVENDSELGTNNLSLEKLLNECDMMNISMEDPQEAKEFKSSSMIVELKEKQQKLERRLDFLKRKIRKLQARHMGQHISSEIIGVFDNVQHSLKSTKEEQPSTSFNQDDDKLKSTKSLIKKLETISSIQASSSTKQKHLIKYFGSGSVENNNYNNVVSVVAPWSTEQKYELNKVSGMLHTELSLIQHEVDSEATESSSGGESCDEFQSYNNPHQQYLSIQKRALWKYLTSRAQVAARWTWLQAQISDLEYRIRQHTDLHKQIRSNKGPVILGGENPPCQTLSPSPPPITTTVNGYKGQLPGSSPLISSKSSITNDITSTTNNGVVNNIDYQCARTRPLVNFKKRKLLQTAGLHIVSKKASRPTTIRCNCTKPSVTCAVCTGRTDPTHPRDLIDTLSKSERIALIDSGFHPVFSLPEDVSCSVHCDAIMKIPEWQHRSTRMKSMKVLKGDRGDKNVLDVREKKIEHRKKFGRILKPSTVSALSAKIKKKMRGRRPKATSLSSSLSGYKMHRKKMSKLSGQIHSSLGDDEDVETIGNHNSASGSPSTSPLLHMQSISGYSRKNRSHSYDIDNIVIPYSVAASTRVEKLQYKEILTPKWRIANIDMKCDTKINGAVRNSGQESDVEDLSEDAVCIRHDKSEYEEKKKFLSYLKLPLGYGRSRAQKRNDSLAESSGANTPDPMSPHPNELQEHSPLTSPPATPLPSDELSSTTVLRKRTISQTTKYLNTSSLKDNSHHKDDNSIENINEIPPYEIRLFPLDNETYNKMLENMPENHQFKTNVRAQDDNNCSLIFNDEKAESLDSESTESAIGEEDPNDPEWMEMDRSKDRLKR